MIKIQSSYLRVIIGRPISRREKGELNCKLYDLEKNNETINRFVRFAEIP